MQTLREIMAVYGSSLPESGALTAPSPEQDEGFQRALDAAVDPALEMCVAGAEAKARVRRDWDAPVFVLNCLTYMKVNLSFGVK
jgi:hypothetical protein